MKKKIVWLVVIVLVSFTSFGQGQSIQLRPNYKGLLIGSKMPDLSLGTVINNTTGKTKFSDFKGKLVILDFWSTNCTSCIEGFPHLSELQKKFGDRIQVFLVNYLETEKEVNSRLAIMAKNQHWGNVKSLFPSNLPVIVDAKKLGSLFPARAGIGYQVWIDGAGIVRGRGFSWNAYEEKIEDLLAGKEVSIVMDGVGDFDLKQLPLYTVLNKTMTPVLQFNSLLTRFTDQFDPFAMNIINQPDSIAGTMRNAWINNAVLSLYSEATKAWLQKDRELIGNVVGRWVLEVNDTLRYWNTKPFYTGPLTDKTMTGCRFSYEQMTPLNLHDSVRKRYMLEDLNRYFGALYGAEGKIEIKKVPCWRLVRTSASDKLHHYDKYKVGENETQVYDKGGLLLKGYSLREVLEYFVNRGHFRINDFFIDETGYSGKVDIQIADREGIKSVEDLRKELLRYDLDIIKGEREVNILVIREKDYKGNL